MKRKELHLSLIFIVLSALFFRIFLDFLIPMLMGGAISILIHPIYSKLRHGYKNRKLSSSVAALTTLFLFVSLVFIPVLIISYLGVSYGIQEFTAWQSSPFTQATVSSNWVAQLIENTFIGPWLQKIADFLTIDIVEIYEKMSEFGIQAASSLSQQFGNFIKQIPEMSLHFGILLLSIYLFLTEGVQFTRYFEDLELFNQADFNQLKTSFKSLCRSVLMASLASGLVQALIFSLAVLLTGTGSFWLFLISIFLMSFLPIIGSGPLSISFSIWIMTHGQLGAGIVLLIAALISGVADNLVRPMILKGTANLNPILAFLSMMAGMSYFGFSGVFVGPIFVGIFLVFVEIYFKSFKNEE